MSTKRSAAVDDLPQSFDLQSFFPYQTRVFYKAVTDAVSKVYEEQYQMKPYEWRTLAILGNDKSFTAAEIVERSSMNKVSVSRAISSLRKRGWILERPNRCDGRSRVLRLSKHGKSILNELIPQMKKVEQELLSPLTRAEIDELLKLMRKIHAISQLPH